MKKITFVALAALALSSCNSGPQFKVNGVVSDANGKMLYLESSALEGIIPLGMVRSVFGKLARNLLSFTGCV